MKLLPQCAVLLFCVLTFSACEKKELPVPLHDPGAVTTATVNMDVSYKWQLYYNLNTNSIVSQNLKTAWDIAFECTPTGYHILLNSSKAMFALNTHKSNAGTVSYADTAGFGSNKRWDAVNGSMDSTAIGDWRSHTDVYILDRGYDEHGTALGFEKLQLLSVNDSCYSIMFSSLADTSVISLTIRKDSTYNFTFLSFDNGGQVVTIEPPKNSWDIVFTQYTEVFYNPVMPYIVTGCLLNRYHTVAAVDSSNHFSEIGYSHTKNYQFSTAVNAIGYNWKSYSGTQYTVNSAKNYIIQNSAGAYYKLHFIDFYNSAGAKGNPKWEYQRL